jgi:hypothetical protein
LSKVLELSRVYIINVSKSVGNKLTFMDAPHSFNLPHFSGGDSYVPFREPKNSSKVIVNNRHVHGQVSKTYSYTSSMARRFAALIRARRKTYLAQQLARLRSESMCLPPCGWPPPATAKLEIEWVGTIGQSGLKAGQGIVFFYSDDKPAELVERDNCGGVVTGNHTFGETHRFDYSSVDDCLGRDGVSKRSDGLSATDRAIDFIIMSTPRPAAAFPGILFQ